MTADKKLISDLSSIVSNVNRVQDHIDDLMKQNTALRFPKSIIKLELYEDVKYPERRYDSYNRTYYDDFTTVELCDNMITKLGENHAIMLERKDKNAAAIKNNLEVLDNAVKFMTSLGLTTTYGEYKGSGNRRKYVSLTSPWYSSILQQIPTVDGWYSYESAYKIRMKDMQDKKENIIKQQKEKEEKEKREKDTKEKEFELAKLKVKYNLDAEANADDLLDSILSKNKYLCLAHYLELNREDWNDGYDYAQMGIDNFTIDSDLDQKIYNNITSYFDDFSDGRVFRDCEYNYSFLYGIVKEQNQELYNDYKTAFELLNFFNPRY
jgi:hypothetical protein